MPRARALRCQSPKPILLTMVIREFDGADVDEVNRRRKSMYGIQGGRDFEGNPVFDMEQINTSTTNNY